MELLRPDYLAYIGEIRRTLLAIVPELVTDKARDDVACADQMLCLLEAESDYLASHQAQLENRFDALAAHARALPARPELAVLLRGLDEIDGSDWSDPRARVAALHVLFQQEMPALSVLADAGVSGAGDILVELLRSATEDFQAVRSRRDSFAPVSLDEESGSGAALSVEDVPQDDLRDYLRSVFPEEPALDIVDVHNIPGGRSKETTLIALSGVSRLPRRIVMRADVPGGLVPSRSTDEFAIIALAERQGVPVPKPLHCERDASRLGRTFILVSAAEGRTEGHYFTDLHATVDDKPAIGRQLAQILARIHAIPLAALADTHLDTSGDLGELVRGTIETTYEQARSFDFPNRVHIEMAYRWLKANLHLAEDERCLIHCDVGLHNMLIDRNRITAMLDWELATIASPAREIAKIFHLIDYLMPREKFFAEYLGAGGIASAVDPDRLNFYAIMNYMITSQRSRFANRLFFAGQRRNIVMANAGYDSFYRTTLLLSNMLRPVYPDAYRNIAGEHRREDA